MALTLDSAPSSMKITTFAHFVVSGAVTTPTTGNSSVANGGDNLTVIQVRALGGGQYRISCIVPPALSKTLDSTTGYAWTITVDAENVVSGNITLLPPPGFAYIDLVSPTTTSSLLTGYAAHTAVTGDQLVYSKIAYPEGLTITPSADSTFTLSGSSTYQYHIDRYVIGSTGTVYATETLSESVTTTVTVPETNSNEGNPTISGTCNVDGSSIELTIDGTDVVNTVSSSGVWSVNTQPELIAPTRVFSSNQSSGTTLGSYYVGPDMVEASNGDIIVACREGTTHADNTGRIVRKKSSDGGVTFGSSLVVQDDPTYDCRANALGVASNGNVVIWLATTQSTITGVEDMQDMGYKVSTDNGDTFGSFNSEYATFPDAETYFGAPYVVPFGRAVQTSNGLMQTFWGFNQAFVLFSTDNGVTWGNRQIAYDYSGNTSDAFNELCPIRLDDDNLVMLIRRQGENEAFCFSRTDDGGLTWSAPSLNIIDLDTSATATSPPTPYGIKLGDDIVISTGLRKNTARIISMQCNGNYFYYQPATFLDENYVGRREVWASATNFRNLAAPIDFGMPPVTASGLTVWYDNADMESPFESTDVFIASTPRL